MRDVAEGLIVAVGRGRAGHRFMLGGEAIPLKQILELMAAIRGRRARRFEVAGRVAEIGAAVLEFIADHVTRRSHSDKAEGVRITLRAEAIEQKGAGRCAHFSTAECCAVLVGTPRRGE
ncbi:hypothetical protein [Bradyrhizobium retamae]|uniref:Uncharacterized protein n=1 Tax=Bradyrhizobium retamae TaxID=1300035 RepID=A0A0R3MNZ4_9BRAD|nr:hypothetical protein CQ13_34205 [Bradyrhizobium retamae]